MKIVKSQIKEKVYILFLTDGVADLSLEDIKYANFERVVFNLDDVKTMSVNEAYMLAGFSAVAKKTNVQVELRGVSPTLSKFLRDYKVHDYIYVENAIEPIDLNGATLIGKGCCGEVYRISGDEILKLYYPQFDYEMISIEKKYAREALVLGFPTAISGKLVSYDGRIGIVFEMINAETFINVIRKDLKNVEKYGRMFAKLAKTIHKIEVPNGVLPNKLNEQIGLFEEQTFLTEEENKQVQEIIDSLPKKVRTCIHGDYHPGNVMYTGDELLFIDMGDVAVAHPYEDVAQIFTIFTPGYCKEELAQEMFAIDPQNRQKFIDAFLDEYFDHPTKEYLENELKEIKKYSLMRQFFFIKNFESTREFNKVLIRRLLKEIK